MYQEPQYLTNRLDFHIVVSRHCSLPAIVINSVVTFIVFTSIYFIAILELF